MRIVTILVCAAIVAVLAVVGMDYLSGDDAAQDRAGQRTRHGNVQQQPGHRPAEQTPDGRPSQQPADPTPPPYIRSIEAVAVPEGVVYHVHPTRAGRLADRAELEQAWDQAVREGVPDRAGLYQQFMCHPLSVIARAKPTWDLESWRPTVGQLRTMLAGCDPG